MILLPGCSSVYFTKKFNLTPEKGEVSSLKIVDAPRVIVNQKTCSGHIDDTALYSGKPDFQVGEAELTFIRLPRRLDLRNNWSTVQAAIKSDRAITATVRVTGQLSKAPERGDLHNQVVPLSNALRERLSTELRIEDPSTELRIICHGKTSKKDFATFCDGVIVPNSREGRAKSGDAFVAEMRTSFHSWTQQGCVDDAEFCQQECDQRVDPLILDTAGNGLALTSLGGGVNFDINNIGIGQDMSWIAKNSDDALLVRDVNHDGKITNGSELFGTSTVLVDEYFGANGFKTLSDADLNGDSLINSSDAIFGDLQLWFDKNANGISETGELKAASEFIDSISLGITPVNTSDGRGNTIFAKADVRMKGESAPVPRLIDVWFDARPLPNLTGR